MAKQVLISESKLERLANVVREKSLLSTDFSVDEIIDEIGKWKVFPPDRHPESQVFEPLVSPITEIPTDWQVDSSLQLSLNNNAIKVSYTGNDTSAKLLIPCTLAVDDTLRIRLKYSFSSAPVMPTGDTAISTSNSTYVAFGCASLSNIKSLSTTRLPYQTTVSSTNTNGANLYYIIQTSLGRSSMNNVNINNRYFFINPSSYTSKSSGYSWKNIGLELDITPTTDIGALGFLFYKNNFKDFLIQELSCSRIPSE